MEYTLQSLISFLKENNIPFKIKKDSSLEILQDDLLPYEADLRKTFPSFHIPYEDTDQQEASGKKKRK